MRQVAPLLSYSAPSRAPRAKITSQLPTKSFMPMRKGPSAPTREAATSKPAEQGHDGRSQHCRQEHADFFVSRKDQHTRMPE